MSISSPLVCSVCCLLVVVDEINEKNIMIRFFIQYLGVRGGRESEGGEGGRGRGEGIENINKERERERENGERERERGKAQSTRLTPSCHSSSLRDQYLRSLPLRS